MMRAIVLVTAVLLGASTNAEAFSSGVAQGRLLFYNQQGNFCPASRDCYGAKYTQAEWMTNLGVSDAKVYLRNLQHQVIGQGVTDAAGNYIISWFDPSTGPYHQPFTQAYLVWHLEHKDGRFVVKQANGNAFSFQTGVQWIGPSTWMGNATWGGPGAPSLPANLYNGAWRSWYHSLSQSNLLVSYFGGVDIRFAAGECATSCANGILNTIWMNPGSELSPQSRILHEMGHLASVKSSSGHARLQAFNVYGYPGNNAQVWNMEEPEFGSAQFEEALATFFGDAALYYPWAATPHTCFSDAPCSPGQLNIEQGMGVACGVDVNRWPINNVRYFWDLYDYNQDYPGETMMLSIGNIADSNSLLPDGYDNGGKNEPFFMFWMDDNDGRSSRDFHDRLMISGTVTTSQIINNCGMVGD
jgi:hypothetical protein